MDVNEADRTKTQRTIGGRLARSFLAVLASSLFVPVSCSAFAYGGFQALFLLEDRRAPLPWVLLEGPDGEVSLLSSEAEVQAATEDLVARSSLGDPGPHFELSRPRGYLEITEGSELTWTVRDLDDGDQEVNLRLSDDDSSVRNRYRIEDGRVRLLGSRTFGAGQAVTVLPLALLAALLLRAWAMSRPCRD